jgi:hypothetical protein
LRLIKSLAVKSLSRFSAGFVANLSRASNPKLSRTPQLKICGSVQLAYRASPSNLVVAASPKSIAIRNGAVLQIGHVCGANPELQANHAAAWIDLAVE